MKFESFIPRYKSLKLALLIIVISTCSIFYSCKNAVKDSNIESDDKISVKTTVSPTNSAVDNDIEKTDGIDLANNKIDSTKDEIDKESSYKQPVIIDKSEENNEKEENNNSNNNIVEKTEDDILEYILPYYQQNNDTIGYVRINDTPIDYPVLQYEDNYYYLHYDFNHNPSSKGCIFLDYKCDFQDFSSTRNNILYGHRMKDGTMFKGIVKYFDVDFYNNHRIISFDTLYGKYQWEVFSVFETHIRFNYINTDFPTDEIWVEFLNECKDKSIYKSDVQLDADDIVLTLSTCAIDDMRRCVVMTRLISQSNDDSSTLVSDVLIPSDDGIYAE